jgi:outer membrane protein assembly factor BamB
MLRRLFACTLVVASLLPATARAQVSARGLIEPAAARQLGLERAWFTQLSLDRNRSQLAGVFQRVSTTRQRIVFDFVAAGVRSTFSARELEEAGRPIRDVAVLAVLEESQPASTPPQDVVKAKFKVTAVLAGPTLAQANQVLELPYLGDTRKGQTFLITGSNIIPTATPPVLSWWNPLALTEQAQKILAAEGAFTAGVDRALQNAEQEIARMRLAMARLNPKGLPDDDKLPVIDGHVIPEITLYASSQRGLVQAIDAETGKTLWNAQIGTANYPTTVPGANDDFVAVINGSQVYVLSAADGTVVWSKPALGAPGAGPALSDSLLFIPMISGAIETYFIDEPKRPIAVFRSFGRAMIQPVVSASSVAWPTDRGNLYVGNANVPDMRFRLEAKDSIDAAPAFLAPNLIFATSRDGYVYCFTESRGTVLWRFTTGEPIALSPVALHDTVYAITDRGNLYAINVEDATEKWVVGGMRQYLAGNDQRIYCQDVAGNLAILDAKSGGLVGTLAAQSLDMPILNVQTDRIFLANSGGLLQCLRETQSLFPVVHFGEIKKKRPPTSLKPGQKATEPAEAGGEKPASDPFAAPAGQDPFAAPGAGGAGGAAPPAGADPFAPAPAAGADPFKQP